jgi:hypothetical protein
MKLRWSEEAAQLKQQLHICLRRQQLNMLVVLPWLRQTVWGRGGLMVAGTLNKP